MLKIMKSLFLFSSVFFLQQHNFAIVNASTGFCEDICVFNETATCAEILSNHIFGGSCCSLSDNLETGGCTISISNGYCHWHDPCNTGCTPRCPMPGEEMWCVIPYMQISANSTMACPATQYEALDREQPICTDDPCLNDDTTIDDTNSENITAPMNTTMAVDETSTNSAAPDETPVAEATGVDNATLSSDVVANTSSSTATSTNMTETEEEAPSTSVSSVTTASLCTTTIIMTAVSMISGLSCLVAIF